MARRTATNTTRNNKTSSRPSRPSRGKKSVTAPVSEETTDCAVRPGTRQAQLIDMLRREGGATLAEIVEATGWQAHSVRGAISGTVKKKLGLAVSSDAVDGRGRVYRIAG